MRNTTLAVSLGLLWVGFTVVVGVMVEATEPNSPGFSIWLVPQVVLIIIGLTFSCIFVFQVPYEIATGGDETWRFFVRHLNPFHALVYYPIYGVVVGVAKVWKARKEIVIGIIIGAASTFRFLWFCIKSVGFFLWKFFKIIHSDIRLLCLVDAAIGATVGYFYGNPLLGAAIGGPLGWLNFELVSKRWFKFVPMRISA